MGSNQTTVAVLKGGTHLDYRKLLVDVDGNLYVRGTTTQGGLSKAIKTQKMTVNDVAQLIPATALEDRNTISIRNWGTVNFYFGGSDVTPEEGYPQKPEEEIVMDITDAIGL